jgi:hypothetical protein
MIFPCLIGNLKPELKSLKKMNSSKNTKPLKRDSAVMSFVVPDYEDEMKEMLDRIQDLNILPEEIEDELSLLLKKLKS